MDIWATDRNLFVTEYDTSEICGYYSYDRYFSHQTRNYLKKIDGAAPIH